VHFKQSHWTITSSHDVLVQTDQFFVPTLNLYIHAKATFQRLRILCTTWTNQFIHSLSQAFARINKSSTIIKIFFLDRSGDVQLQSCKNLSFVCSPLLFPYVKRQYIFIFFSFLIENLNYIKRNFSFSSNTCTCATGKFKFNRQNEVLIDKWQIFWEFEKLHLLQLLIFLKYC
jgi:hypothetical protein